MRAVSRVFWGAGSRAAAWTGIFRRRRPMQIRLAGIRNRSAHTQAAGEAKQAAVYPNTGTRKKATPVRAAISSTPARMANPLYPIPWMEKRTMLTRERGMKKALLITIY